MKVAVIDSEGNLLVVSGECDPTKIEDGMFVKVDGQFRNCANVFPVEHAVEVCRILQDAAAEFKRARDAHAATIYQVGNKYRTLHLP